MLIATPPSSPSVSVHSRAQPKAGGLVDDYAGQLDSIRDKEYPHLRPAFLDHAGSTVYAANHIRAYTEELLTNVPANPHSRHAQSQWTHAQIDQTRDRLLAFLGTSTSKYAAVFTANATAAIRLAAELTPLTADGSLCYARESHTSVVGLRNIAADQGVRVRPVEFSDIEGLMRPEKSQGTSLVAYPAQCNFSGERFPLDVADKIASQFPSTTGHLPWWVLVDAAAYASSSPLNLDSLPVGPDFVALSMYKIFGAPTGLGVLLIRRSSVPYLRQKRFFGGGTVAGLAFDRPWQVFRSDVEARLEDGTLNFHDIISLRHALDAHARIYGSIDSVARHTRSVTKYAVSQLRSLKHGGGQALCEIYGHADEPQGSGPTVAFNVKGADGQYMGYIEVERLAVMAGISLRSGRFCNPGAAQRWLSLETSELIRHSSMGLVCGDDNDLVDGKPVGALRVSFGAMTSKRDVDILIEFLRGSFYNYSSVGSAIPAELDTNAERAPTPAESEAGGSLLVEVDRIVIYPVKSCHGWVIPGQRPWEITSHGLRFDRSFVIMRENGSVPMQQKRYPNMALIRPHVNVDESVLVLNAPDHPPLEISLLPQNLRLEGVASDVCSTRMQAMRVHSEEISSWLTSVLSVSCYLACEPRLLEPGDIMACGSRGLQPKASFANQAQILMVTQESARQVEKWVNEDSPPDVPTSRTQIGPLQYRPNIVVKALRGGSRAIRPFEELSWAAVDIGGAPFNVSGPCRRCQMISVDQDSASKLKEPYSTLARRARVDGKVVFGIYLDSAESRARPAGKKRPTIRTGGVLNVAV
ncbi:hypothetical protein GGF46_003056 [Coemansia sp. RSA 552]|nr:hypothetical protein GGF46_003056 [Coemansia sp. RSA 552]